MKSTKKGLVFCTPEGDPPADLQATPIHRQQFAEVEPDIGIA